MADIHIIGAGMAGSEAAWQCANSGLMVKLYEMRPNVKTCAHKTGNFAELVCSNSFRSSDHNTNAVGLLHWEMRRANGLIINTADKYALPAGGALAIDREKFSVHITQTLRAHPHIEIVNEEITHLPHQGNWIIATGPLTSEQFGQDLRQKTGEAELAFFDAIAPIVYADSVDMTQAWFQSRYDKGYDEKSQNAYLNCPLDRPTYERFIDKLLESEQKIIPTDEKTSYFNGCLPIEEMARRGRETLRFGPLKPVGLTNPHATHKKPYAVLQLRHENEFGTLFNMVGCQTKMKYAHQGEAFRMIPALQNARFARLGGMHRNSFLNSPKLLDKEMRLKNHHNLRFAGQITGVEGYVESAAMGLIASHFFIAEILGKKLTPPPIESAMGALLNHITRGADAKNFQPMNVNFGLFPPSHDTKAGRKSRKDRYLIYTTRAKKSFQTWLSTNAAASKVAASA